MAGVSFGTINVMNIDQEATQQLQNAMPFARLLGIQIVEISPEQVVAKAEWKTDYCTSNGVMHGGYLMSIADTVGAMCSGQHLPENSFTTTIESKTNFSRALKSGGKIIGECTPLHKGRTTMVWQTRVYDENKKLAAQIIQTQIVLSS